MTCAVEHREHIRRAARAIRTYSQTVSADVVAPTAAPYDTWTLDVVLANSTGVSPEILRELALSGLTLRPTPSQAQYQHVMATA